MIYIIFINGPANHLTISVRESTRRLLENCKSKLMLQELELQHEFNCEAEKSELQRQFECEKIESRNQFELRELEEIIP